MCANKQEPTYTESEVFQMLEKYDREFKLDTFAYTQAPKYTVSQWFEDNKKVPIKSVTEKPSYKCDGCGDIIEQDDWNYGMNLCLICILK